MTDHPSYADLADRKQTVAHQAAICRRLGIDPMEATDLQLHVEPGARAYVTWGQRRNVRLGDVPALFALPSEVPSNPLPTMPDRWLDALYALRELLAAADVRQLAQLFGSAVEDMDVNERAEFLTRVREALQNATVA